MKRNTPLFKAFLAIFIILLVSRVHASQCNDGIDNDGDGLIDWNYDLSCINSSDTTEAGISMTLEDGWTNFENSSSTIIYYVSNSTGSDSYDGLAPDAINATRGPKKTLSVTIDLIRNNSADWMLLRRGDTWSDQAFGMSSQVYGQSKSGKSRTEPIIVASYGNSTVRPRLVDSYFTTNSNQHTGNLVMLGLEFDRVDLSKSGTPFGLYMFGYGDNYLFEDMYIHNYGMNAYIDSQGALNTNLTFRRSIIVDAHSNGYASGFLVGGVQNSVYDENVIDHNGWINATSFPSNVYNHNMYNYYSGHPVTITNNILSRASSNTFTIPNGTIENNSFLQNPIAVSTQSYSVIRNNVFLDGRDIDANMQRGYGMYNDGMEALIEGNIFAHNDNGTDGAPMFFINGATNLTIRNNVIYDWVGKVLAWLTYASAMGIDGPITGTNTITNNTVYQPYGYIWRFTGSGSYNSSTMNFSHNKYYTGQSDSNRWFAVSNSDVSMSSWASVSGETDATYWPLEFLDANRTVNTYMASIGGTPTLEAFLDEARLQSKYNWRPQYTAQALNEYIRQGYQLTSCTTNCLIITSTAGSGGSVSPSSLAVSSGNSRTVTITANSGYIINNVIVDSVSQGNIASYAFNNIVTNHTLSATFNLTAPSTPQNFAANATATNQVVLTWNDLPTEDNYTLERSSGGNYTVITNPASNSTSYTDNNGLTAVTYYTYRILASNSKGSSGYASTSVTTPSSNPTTTTTSGGSSGGGGGGSSGGGGGGGSSIVNETIRYVYLNNPVGDNQVIESVAPGINSQENNLSSFEYMIGLYIATFIFLIIAAVIIFLNYKKG